MKSSLAPLRRWFSIVWMKNSINKVLPKLSSIEWTSYLQNLIFSDITVLCYLLCEAQHLELSSLHFISYLPGASFSTTMHSEQPLTQLIRSLRRQKLTNYSYYRTSYAFVKISSHVSLVFIVSAHLPHIEITSVWFYHTYDVSISCTGYNTWNSNQILSYI